MDSILTSVKKICSGIQQDDDSFDIDMIIYINSVFSILNQLGVGPVDGFSIKDDSAVWTDFIPKTDKLYKKLEDVKTYVGLKVKLIFDPPQGAALIDSVKSLISEFEWRINVAVEDSRKTE